MVMINFAFDESIVRRFPLCEINRFFGPSTPRNDPACRRNISADFELVIEAPGECFPNRLLLLVRQAGDGVESLA